MNQQNRFRNSGVALSAALVVFLSSTSPILAAGKSSPVRLEFAKSVSGPGIWSGVVSGHFAGDLTTVLLEPPRITGTVWHVKFDWIIENTGGRDFVARLEGILNTKTGRVVMNGTVIDGYLLGARVHEEGQLVDPATLSFEGTIRIMPSTAD